MWLFKFVAYSSAAGIGGARRRRVAERSGAMKREGTRGTPESPSKMASLPFLKTGFLAKTRESLCKQLTRPPWRYCYKENGKCSFGTQVFYRKKCRRKRSSQDIDCRLILVSLDTCEIKLYIKLMNKTLLLLCSVFSDCRK